MAAYTADKDAIRFTGKPARSLLWEDIRCIFVTRSCQVGNELVVIFGADQSAEKEGMGVSQLDEGFEEVLAAAEKYLIEKPMDWQSAIQNAQVNRLDYVWTADGYEPEPWPPLDSPSNSTTAYDLPEVSDPTDRSELDAPFYDWLDQQADLIDAGWEKRKEPDESLRILSVLFWLQAEVPNGGLDQYFWNSSGNDALQAAEGLRTIGETVAADALESEVSTHAPGLRLRRVHPGLANYDLGVLPSTS